jgi:hypothetical protein
MNKKGIEDTALYVIIILIILAISIFIIFNVLNGEGGLFGKL